MPLDSPPPQLLPLSHPSLWPPTCPLCNYPFTGLPSPRCPECGDSIAPDEIVLLGRVHRESNSLSTNGSGLVGSFFILILLVFAMGMLLTNGSALWIYAPTVTDILAAIAPPALLVTLVATIVGYFQRRHGSPPGIIRLSPSGYRFGTGKHIGILLPWRPHTRLRFHFYRNGTLGFHACKMLGPFPLYSLFHLIINTTPEQLTQTILHLQHWQPSNILLQQSTPLLRHPNPFRQRRSPKINSK